MGSSLHKGSVSRGSWHFSVGVHLVGAVQVFIFEVLGFIICGLRSTTFGRRSHMSE